MLVGWSRHALKQFFSSFFCSWKWRRGREGAVFIWLWCKHSNNCQEKTEAKVKFEEVTRLWKPEAHLFVYWLFLCLRDSNHRFLNVCVCSVHLARRVLQLEKQNTLLRRDLERQTAHSSQISEEVLPFSLLTRMHRHTCTHTVSGWVGVKKLAVESIFVCVWVCKG